MSLAIHSKSVVLGGSNLDVLAEIVMNLSYEEFVRLSKNQRIERIIPSAEEYESFIGEVTSGLVELDVLDEYGNPTGSL